MKKSLKSIVIMLLSFLMVSTLCGCTQNEPKSIEQKMVVEVNSDGGKKVEVEESEPKVEPKVNYIKSLSGEQRKALNTFLSNFSEAYFYNYDRSMPNYDDILNWAHIHIKINRYKHLSYEGNNEVFSSKLVDEVTQRYLGITIPHIDRGRYDYTNGKYYTIAADGEMYNFFSTAKEVYKNADGTLTVDFAVFTDTNNDADINRFYGHTYEQALNCVDLELSGKGTATVIEKTYNGKETYELINYYQN